MTDEAVTIEGLGQPWSEKNKNMFDLVVKAEEVSVFYLLSQQTLLADFFMDPLHLILLMKNSISGYVI